MRALVTGAAGFVGANLVRELLGAGHEPIAAVRPGGDRWRLDDLAGALPVLAVNLSEHEAVEQMVVDERPDIVFHLAAHGAYSWQRDFDAMLAVNVRATEALLAGARRVDARVVHSGSSSEYGHRSHAPSELDRVEPNSHYAVTKAAATHLCRLASATHGQSAVTLRLYSVYGPWEEPGRLMPTLVERGRAGCLPPLVAPDTARDFVWVGDVCDALLRAAHADLPEPGAVFNVSSGTQTRLRELVDVARRVFAIEEEPAWGTMEARAWDTSTWFGDPTSASEGLGWRASTPLEAGLRRLDDWFAERSDLVARYASPAPEVTGDRRA
jgi:dolichol-phosphate mannosyltransferase